MSEYWKSTPSYWCKFCETYVRDSPIERKNHESTGKHQGNIQRSLRELHKKHEREARDQQRAKDEVARLNGLVAGRKREASAPGAGGRSGAVDAPVVKLSATEQRKVHAQQLLEMGVALPDALKREITGVSGWETVSETVVRDEAGGVRTLADIKREEEEREAGRMGTTPAEGLSVGVRKRKAEDEAEVARDEEAAPRTKKIWGSTLKTFPGQVAQEDDGDLDALLGVVAKKASVATIVTAPSATVDAPTDLTANEDEPVQSNATTAEFNDEPEVKTETNESAVTAPPVVVFKKRKAPRR
ncbi:hypothetical protein B0A48_08138 [Cryoendolithus antarcticus]|uniref:Matrin-type domain-containing protein n=1 Tax=Cryoendolithus antarcticus TaxID=1507870 RepID=A0A1V8T1M2_9PEZI|nr:hypothetical protein B0A48_08138 [Cryoendolithus antarcticus]